MNKKTTFLIKTCASFFLLLLGFLMTGYGQASSKCFNFEKIKKLYGSTFMEINATLFQENWEIVSNSTQAPFSFGKDTIMYDNFSQWKFDLSVDKWFLSLYRKQGLQSILTLQTSKNCYETIEAEIKKNKSFAEKTVEDSIQHLSIFHIRQGMDVVFSSRTQNQLYLIIVCDYTQVDTLIKIHITEKEGYAKILQEQRQTIRTALEEVDFLRAKENYAAAIICLENVMNQPYFERDELIIESMDVKNKIETLKKEYDLQQVQNYLKLANAAYENENYALSKEYLLQAQQIDAKSAVVIQKIREIERIESMLIIRKDSIFNYAFYNQPTCNEIQTAIFHKMKNYFFTVDAGDIGFSVTLSTDTLGQTISSYQIDEFSLRPVGKSTLLPDSYETWSSFLNSLVLKPIPAVKIEPLFVNAASHFPYQSSWKTSFVKVKYGGKKIKFSPYAIPATDKKKLKTYFESDKIFSHGNYTVEKKEIKYQDSLYNTLTLKKVYSVGAEAMLYSMVFPGAGSLAATQGKKGWAALSTFVVFAGAGTAGWIVADKLYKEEKINSKNRNIIKWSSWGCLGVGGVIYISDIFVALKRGLDNAEKTRAIKAKLKEKPIPIQEFPPQIEY